MPLRRMVLEANMHWRIECDYEGLKQVLGLGHYEGRSCRGSRHRASDLKVQRSPAAIGAKLRKLWDALAKLSDHLDYADHHRRDHAVPSQNIERADMHKLVEPAVQEADNEVSNFQAMYRTRRQPIASQGGSGAQASDTQLLRGSDVRSFDPQSGELFGCRALAI